MTDAKALGNGLKSRRCEMNLSLKEAENGTSIRTSYLKAIEEGDLGAIISPVYAEGFVKQYANFLQLDGDNLVKENRELFVRSTDQTFDYGIGTLEVRENAGSNHKWIPGSVWVVTGLILILTVGFAIYKWGFV